MDFYTERPLEYDQNIDCFQKNKSIPSVLLSGDITKIKDPFFSVVIPTYQRFDLLKEAVESARQLRTNGFSYNIIIVDNDDDFENKSIMTYLDSLADIRILYYKNKQNLCAVGNWNRALELATANWVCYLHDDDLLLPECLLHMYAIITKMNHCNKKEIGFIRSSADVIYSSDLIPAEVKVGALKKAIQKRLHAKYCVTERTKWAVYLTGGAAWAGAPTCGTIINRRAMTEIGGYDTQYNPCPDLFPVYRMLGKYKVFKTMTSLGVYRWAQNDTYREKTLIGLVEQFYFFLEYLSSKHKIVKFFSEEYYVNQVNWCIKKAQESGKTLTPEDFSYIHTYCVRSFRRKLLKCLLMINKIITIMKAKRYKVPNTNESI